ncbi:MAG: PIN domain nuclease [Myxococcales bacterium]|nr:PIN domain nuclease [Myxococcales bacterium]
MKVLVDTSVWSLGLRRGAPRDGAVERELAELVRDGRVMMLGAVRQELLSGVKSDGQFKKLRDQLGAFDDLALETSDYESAAECSNRCRAKGIQGSTTDFLICAAARSRSLALFTTDGDFPRFAKVIDLKLHKVRAQFQ